MKSLSAAELLEVWEWGIDKPHLDRIVRLLEVVFDSEEDIMQMSIGERDNALFLVRRDIFGRLMNCTLTCPECNETIEWVSDLDILCKSDYHLDFEHELSLHHGNMELKFRLPNSEDLIQIWNDNTDNDFSKKLAARCITSVKQGSRDVELEEISQLIIDQMEEAMEKADPMANIYFQLECPGCSHQWNEVFDILSYFWKEIDSWTRKLLQDVSILAINYGWTEKEILELSPFRRQYYLSVL